ncbi:MAG: pseudouridine synthase [Verrucomicrobiota bacterium]
MLVRLQKYLADAGVASRRASEEIIRSGRVTVNRQPVREMGAKVDPLQDAVAVDGVTVKPKRKLYIALHKPIGYVSTRHDPRGRRTVMDLLPKEWVALYTVGRLDYNTEGLIFLTNDGDFALHLTHPRYGVRKKYQAVVEGTVGPEHTASLVKGLFHEGERLKAEKARVLESSRAQSLVELELAEGKNREARRLFEAQGFRVLGLKRIQIGPIKLGELRSGRWRSLSAAEVEALLKPAGEQATKATARIDRRRRKNFTRSI